jgi:hypothetical protein
VGLKGADRYANPGDGEPNAVRRTSLDERSESSGISTAGRRPRTAASPGSVAVGGFRGVLTVRRTVSINPASTTVVPERSFARDRYHSAMSPSPLELVEDLRRPEHTGERRCWPCTVVNVVLVLGAAVAVARRRRLAALPVVLVGTTLVYLRGYVVPGTPWFAPRLVAALPLPYDPFEHEVPGHEPPRETLDESESFADPGADAATNGAEDRATGSASDPRYLGDSGLEGHDGDLGEEPEGAPRANAEPDALGEVAEGTSASNQRPPGADDAVEPDEEAVLSALVEAGVVVVGEERVAPDPDFRADWEAEMADLASLDTDELAEAVHDVAYAAESRVVSDEHGEWVVLGDGSGEVEGRTWLPRPVAVAEAGAVRALAGWGLDRPTRLAAAGALRTFLETCPDCGSALAETTTAACCGGYTSPKEEPADVLFCPDCDVRLFTFDG